MDDQPNEVSIPGVPESLIYDADTVLTAEELAAAHRYLREKWGPGAPDPAEPDAR